MLGVVGHGLLHAVDDLLYQMGIVALEIGFFESDVCRFSKFLVSSAKVILEIDPRFVDVWSTIPVGDASFETSCFVKNDVGFGNGLALG